MANSICLLGGGAMGTACANVLAVEPTHDVRLWVRNPAYAHEIAESRENKRLLPGVRLADSILVTADAEAALKNANMVVVCVPTRGIRDVITTLKSHIPSEALLVSAVKGIENETLIRPSQMIQQLLGDRPVVAFGGPCHAEEVACGRPATVVAASDSLPHAEIVQQAFSNNNLRVYSNNDLLGVELAGALKNVIAIAAGISDGLQFGDNAKAALITRGLAEMVRFGEAMGAVPDTFYGLAGIGDLIATCGSQHSRNRRVGELLGQGQSLREIQDAMHAVAEGVFTARSIQSISQERQLDMPIAQEVFNVLFENKSPRTATIELMQRPLKPE
ncbi:NAD(P)H-dependent glycerol-3-phosphate dehydrogenase [Fuerstiella marisgermanici]|uniref:Glycerol-3-phosphate dehydrogenase [NAD(P)+] n=1 Tax=Fuerstiella marisgermanici TaxID=1891926 RepID=A0A1P8WA12_9PLAN|nr:NAD(P)H-dependent glycerol-3-phosphate dehydrogenase [Fuerstiella marisgermanici]APZ90886.1 Glycerol-3-phosphate dehydrogenase [NAD(P)+] [Fuerstiella marisgermanici]